MAEKRHQLLPLEDYDPYKPPGSQGMQSWNIGGRILSSTVEPQPTLKNPGRYWVQDEENVWREVDPLDFPEPRRLSELMGGEAAAQQMERMRLSDIMEP